MDTNRFIVYIKTEGIYAEFAKDIQRRFDTSNHELDRLLPKWKNKKSNWFDEKIIWWNNNKRICCIKSKNI